MLSLYCTHFKLEENPFSIAPDPRFVYLSERHREALGHLLYGLGEGGGFVQLTGEVGTGKTTICRTLLRQLPDDVDVALIFNPKLTAPELLQTICEELRIALPSNCTSTKAFVDVLYTHLLSANTKGRRTVLIVDEAQNLSAAVLEQLRLLTNLETDDNKLLQIFLIGQPELRTMLAGDDMRQLAQRITARYHLEPLSRAEIERYIRYRLSVAGCERPLFTKSAVRQIYRYTNGVPRLVNAVCDRALLGAYSTGRERVNRGIVRTAYRELSGKTPWRMRPALPYVAVGCTVAALSLTISYKFALFPDVSMKSGAYMDQAKEASAPSASPQVESSIPQASPKPIEEELASVALVSLPTDTGEAVAELSSGAEGTDLPRETDDTTQPSFAGLMSPGDPTQPEKTLKPDLGELIKRGDTSMSARKRLFRLWDVPELRSSSGLCQHAEEHGLACLARFGSWKTLRSFDLPALLSLRSGGGKSSQALLVGLRGQDAVLYIDNREHTFRLHEVDRYWTGDLYVLWKPPFDDITTIDSSYSGEAVRWLHEMLSRVDGVTLEGSDTDTFDLALVKRIEDFQRRRGLRVDGVVGPETLIHLSAVLYDPHRPTLSAVPNRRVLLGTAKSRLAQLPD